MRHKRFWIGVATVVPFTALGLLPVGPAAAKGNHYRGPALGTVYCTNVSATIKFAPPLTGTGGGRKVKGSGTISSCGIFDAPAGVTETITSGKVKASVSGSGGGCLGLGNQTWPPLTIKWKGTLSGTISGVTYSGRAKFTSTTVTGNLSSPTWDGSGNVGLYVPGYVHDELTVAVPAGLSPGTNGTVTVDHLQNALGAPDTGFYFEDHGGNFDNISFSGVDWPFVVTTPVAPSAGPVTLSGTWPDGTPPDGFPAITGVGLESLQITGNFWIPQNEPVTGSFAGTASGGVGTLTTGMTLGALAAQCTSGLKSLALSGSVLVP